MAALVKTCRACGREFAHGETFCPADGMRLVSDGRGGVPAPASDDHLVGGTLDGRYLIIDVIGQGGMGIVYEAEHVLIEKRVAVKVLRQDFTRKLDVVERFRQEARSASKIGHPNIIDVIDFGETPGGASYFVMEKLEGEDLAELLSRECVLAPARAVNIVYQCCQALAAAHKKGIFHRDLKPENLFLVRGPQGGEIVKVVDFGVAKMSDLADPSVESSGPRRLTRTGMLFGTPEYMSPEQARGYPLDHRADIYSLGVILYELVTGRVPFEGTNFMEVLSKHGAEPVPDMTKVNPGTIVSPELKAVIHRALCKDRDDRYATMDDMAQALAQVPEMPLGAGGQPPAWALSPPAGPKRGMTRKRIAEQPLRQTEGDAIEMTRARWLAKLAVLPSRSVLAVLALGLAAALGLGWFWTRDDAEPANLAPRRNARTRLSSVADSAPQAEKEEGEGRLPPGRRVAVAGAKSGKPRSLDSTPATGGSARPAEPTPPWPVASAPPRLGAPQRPETGLPASPAPEPGGTSVDPNPQPKLVRLRVLSRPAGARVLPTSAHAGCRRTPCSLLVPKGQSTLVRVRRGKARGSTRVVAEGDGQAIMVLLPTARSRSAIPPPVQRRPIPPARGRGRPSRSTNPTPVAPAQGLKVPEAFR